MAQYLVEGTQGGGKNLFTLSKIHNCLLIGNKVAVNFELYFHNFPLPQMETERYDNLLLSMSPHITYFDLQFLGSGVPASKGQIQQARDDKTGSTQGVIIFDEGLKIFNSRDWNDPSRKMIVDFFIDIRKLQYDLYLISQSAQHIDKQIRESLISNIITCASSKQVFPFSSFHFFLKMIGLGSDVNPLYYPFHVARTHDVVAGEKSKKYSKTTTYRYLEYYTVYDTGQILGAKLPSFFCRKHNNNYFPALFVDNENELMFGDFIQNSLNESFTFGRFFGDSNYKRKSKTTVEIDKNGQVLLKTYYNQGVSHYLPPRFYDDKLYYYSKYLHSTNYKNPNEPNFDTSLKSKISRGDSLVALISLLSVLLIFVLVGYLMMGGYSVFFPELPTTQDTISQQPTASQPQQVIPDSTDWFFNNKKQSSKSESKACEFFPSLEQFGYKQSFVKYPFLDVLRNNPYQITNFFIDDLGDIRFTMLIYDFDNRSKIIDSFSDMDLKSMGFQAYIWGVDKNKLTLALGDTMFFSFDTQFNQQNSRSAIESILPF